MPIADTPRVERSRPADIAATLVLLIVHGFLFGATVALLGLLVMGTDPCDYVKCGDEAWINRAMMVGIWGGGAILIVDFVVAVYLLVRRKLAFFVNAHRVCGAGGAGDRRCGDGVAGGSGLAIRRPVAGWRCGAPGLELGRQTRAVSRPGRSRRSADHR